MKFLHKSKLARMLLCLAPSFVFAQEPTVEVKTNAIYGKRFYRSLLLSFGKVERLLPHETRKIDPVYSIVKPAGTRPIDITRPWHVRIVGSFGSQIVPTVMSRYFVLPIIKEALDDSSLVEFNTRVDDTVIGIVWNVRMPGHQITYEYLRSAAAEAKLAARKAVNSIPNYRANSDYEAFRVCYSGEHGSIFADGRPIESIGEHLGCYTYFLDPAFGNETVLSFDKTPDVVTLASRNSSIEHGAVADLTP